jgi:superfamily II DNA or RNA helicase/diadenosine tetraphosphate (Ap4A) HIT family hydrolase/HKD family nuclease
MSVFTDIPASAWVASNELAFAIRDANPVSAGHTLVITRRVVLDIFGCSQAERAALWALVDEVKRALDVALRPDGYNVGFNAGAAAGQTVPHVHIHVIPRYSGDVEDPRGGVRHVLPDRGNYLARRAEPLTDGVGERTLYRAVAPLLRAATQVDLLAAFVQESGVSLIAGAVEDALRRGARLRVVTGDYLDITQASALRRLLDWEERVVALHGADERPAAGSIETRLIEAATIGRAFHPKAWRIEGDGFGVVFVGSSNLSRSALMTGVEWNLRVDRARDPVAYERVASSFEALWDVGRALDRPWLAAYAARAEAAPARPSMEIEADPPPPTPNVVQTAALAALRASRAAGRDRALVVLATGLGKTLLAVFDLAQVAAELGRTPTVLWVAHRQELLAQAGASAARLFPEARLGWLLGGQRAAPPHGLLFASVQSLSRAATLATLPPDTFDVVVIDEAHHADAASYRRVLAHFRPRFRLGLTATPDRADAGDIYGLFDDHVVFRADLAEGIARDWLVPFAYFGLKDPTDYAPIPWRGGRFDAEALSEAVLTAARMETLWASWIEPARAGARTMVFCVSINHARFVRTWLAERGVRAALVHSGPDGDDRATALDDLEAGRIDAICSVDLFNEGVDCRPVDRVVMLRPTESPVLFLQQLGRGLRTSPGKGKLVVLDFVGNHRVFLDRVRTLVTLSDPGASVGAFLRGAPVSLPPGCSVDVPLEAIDLLERLLPQGTTHELTRVYRELTASRGVRPRAGELVAMGLSPLVATAKDGGWLALVAREGDLSEVEREAVAVAGGWLREVQATPMNKCFKMVTLDVLLQADALFDGLPLDEVARRSHEALVRSPELLEDLSGVARLPDPRHPDPAVWRGYWAENPVADWTRGRWCRVDAGALRLTLDVPAGLREAVADLTRELVEARLAAYRRRRTSAGPTFDAKVITNGRDPILKLPDGEARAALPTGDADVRLPDGGVWRFRFAKIAINVAHPVGVGHNALPDLLRRWFGVAAGRPGTDFRVRLRSTPDGWWAEPLGAVIDLAAERGRFVAYPTLRAAAGPEGSGEEVVEPGEVALPGASSGARFAVRVAGRSMDGGPKPLRDGDWAILELCRGVGVAGLEGRVTLVAVDRGAGEVTHHLKQVARSGAGWALRSFNPDVEPMTVDGATVIARLVDAVAPEALAPAEATAVAPGAIGAAFGVSGEPTAPVDRVDGHLFVLVEGVDRMAAPDRVALAPRDRHPGETAFVLVRPGPNDAWTYLGVGRWRDGAWAVPPPTWTLWKRLSTSRGASRTLDEGWLARADAVAAEIVARFAGETVMVRGRPVRVVGRSAQGGVRIVGAGGQERSVSRTDLAWALAAAEDVRVAGGALDEARVNRLRYLDETPKGSTRWIDTGWAVGLVGIGRSEQV